MTEIFERSTIILGTIMDRRAILFVYFILIVKAKAANKISLEECNLNEVTVDLPKEQMKEKYDNSSGLGLWNILKWDFGHFISNMSEKQLTQMCYCAFKNVYSFEGEKSSIKYENNYAYWRDFPYIGWLLLDYFMEYDEAIKCYIPNGHFFYLVETENLYKTPKTRDLFVLEVSENDLERWSSKSFDGKETGIKYPAGQFKAYIPKVDLTGVV